MRVRALLLCGAFVLTALIPRAACAEFVWRSEIVDSVGDVGNYSSIALDSSEQPHISYSDLSNLDLKHATRTAGGWVVEVVDSAGATGTFTSIAIDDLDRIHVAYHAFDPQTAWQLKYAVRTGDAWSIDVVSTEGVFGNGLSLALDSAGRPHIGYQGDDPSMAWEALRYARKNNGEWLIVTLTADQAGVNGIDFAIDGQGYWSVAWHARSTECLKYTSLRPDIRYEIIHCGGRDYRPAIAFEASGFPRLAFFVTYYEVVRVAWRTPDGWRSEDVEDLGYPTDVALAVDSQDRSIVAYGRTPFRLARKSGGVWAREVIDPTPGAGSDCSMALDSRDRPHVSYYSGASGALRYSRAIREFNVGSEGSGPARDGSRVLAQPYGRIAVHPNPSSGYAPTSIILRLDSPLSSGEIALLDVAGRRVRRIVTGVLTAGQHAVAWDGTDDQGGQLPSGVYFLRVEGAGSDLSTRFVLTR